MKGRTYGRWCGDTYQDGLGSGLQVGSRVEWGSSPQGGAGYILLARTELNFSSLGQCMQ